MGRSTAVSTDGEVRGVGVAMGLSRESLEMLKQIHERGLNVRYRYRVASPEWGDGTPLTPAEWAAIDERLWQIVERWTPMQGRMVRFNAWASDYLVIEQLSSDDEEGNLNSYTLTPLALKLVAADDE